MPQISPISSAPVGSGSRLSAADGVPSAVSPGAPPDAARKRELRDAYNAVLDHAGSFEVVAKGLHPQTSAGLWKLFDVRTQGEMVDVALQIAQKFPADVAAHFELFDIRDLDDRIRIADYLVGRDLSFSVNIHKFNLPADVRARLALKRANLAPQGLSGVIHHYQLEDQAVLIQIAESDIVNDPTHTAENIHNYGIRDKMARLRILVLGILNHPGVIPQRSRFNVPRKMVDDILLKVFIATGWKFNKDLSPDMTLLALVQDPAGKYSVTEPGLLRVLSSHNLPKSFLQIMDSDVQRQDVHAVLGLALSLAILADKSMIVQLAGQSHATVSRYLIAGIVGIEPSLLYGNEYSSRALGDFYELAIRLQQGLIAPALTGIRFSPEVFKGKKIRKVIAFIHSLNRMKGILDDMTRIMDWDKTLADMGIQDVSAQNIDAMTATLDAEFQKQFRAKFRIGGFHMIGLLAAQWGNLDALYTLAARFSGNPLWQNELPLLRVVAEAVLGGWFHQLKYEGQPRNSEDIAKAKAQLAMLPDAEARAGWMANYQTIGVFSAAEDRVHKSLQDLVTASKPLLQSTRLHVTEMLSGVLHKDMDGETVSRISADVHQTPKTETLLKYKKTPGALLVAMLMLLAESNDDANAYQQYLRLMVANLGTLQVNRQVEADIRGLNAALKYTDDDNEAIVYTTTTDNPNLLLRIGDLVDTSSCQNYKWGQHPETLLGYVVDANVKAVLSFALQPRHFKSEAEYKHAKTQAVNLQTPLLFDAPRLRLTIGDVTVALPQAHIRRIVKMGATAEGKAGVGLEPEYHQPHFAENEMRRQVAAAVKILANKSKAVLGEAITIPVSRNSSGVYSDSAHDGTEGSGIKTGAYTMPAGGMVLAPDADEIERVRQVLAPKSGERGFAETVPADLVKPMITPLELPLLPKDIAIPGRKTEVRDHKDLAAIFTLMPDGFVKLMQRLPAFEGRLHPAAPSPRPSPENFPLPPEESLGEGEVQVAEDPKLAALRRDIAAATRIISVANGAWSVVQGGVQLVETGGITLAEGYTAILSLATISLRQFMARHETVARSGGS